MKGTHWTAEMDALLKEGYATTDRNTLMAVLGVSPSALSIRAHKFGLRRDLKTRPYAGRPPTWTPETLDKLRARYPLEGPRLLAKELGLSNGAIQSRAKKLGISVNKAPAKGRRKRTHIARRVGADVTYFDNWSANMAWVLGYTWADGCIFSSVQYKSFKPHRILYGCKEADAELLHFVKRELKTTVPVRRKVPTFDKRRNRQDGPQASLRVNSIALARILVDRFGIEPNKSEKDLPYPEVPLEFLPHFARGYLDGDGSVCHNARKPKQCRVSFCGTPLWLEGFRNALADDLGIFRPAITLHAGTRGIVWAAHDDALKLYRFLYPPGDGYPYLRRKRAKFVELLRLEEPAPSC